MKLSLGTLAVTTLASVATAQYSSSTMTSSNQIAKSQYWHERYHGLLSMSVHGDYNTICPKQAFNNQALQKAFPGSKEAPWKVISRWGPTKKGVFGYAVVVPEMDKVVMVFGSPKGIEYSLDHSVTNIQNLFYFGSKCQGCTANKDAVDAYLEIKSKTNNFATVAKVVAQTGHQWSVTGHGFAGMVAQVAAIDQGFANRVHWSHNHGSPRVFNKAAARLYESLFGGESSQRTVANNDILPTLIPESDKYTFTSQGFHIWGHNKIYGMNYVVCFTATDPNCLGGGSKSDTNYYYTPMGQCGTYGNY